MSLRFAIMSSLATATAALASPALAGGDLAGGLYARAFPAQPCETCYRKVIYPPVYGSVAETVMMRAPRTIAHVVPGEVRSVTETVMVEPERQVWTKSYDAWGHRIKCLVTIPARYETRTRQVTVTPAYVVPQAVPAVYGVYHRQVLVEPSRAGWAP